MLESACTIAGSSVSTLNAEAAPAFGSLQVPDEAPPTVSKYVVSLAALKPSGTANVVPQEVPKSSEVDDIASAFTADDLSATNATQVPSATCVSCSVELLKSIVAGVWNTDGSDIAPYGYEEFGVSPSLLR